jgi:hypothetical protein
MASDAIKVEGLAEMRAALRVFPAEVSRELTKGLRAAVEPARQAIEGRMASEISHMKPGSPWINARTGVARDMVYIVPKERGARGAKAHGKRPNFSHLALSLAYEPSAAEAAAGVALAAEAAIAKAAARMNV